MRLIPRSHPIPAGIEHERFLLRGITVNDLVDLGWHQKEAQLRRSFNYAVLAPDGSRLLGCVYVDPPEKRGADAEVCLWVRSDEEEGDLEAVLEVAVREWLAAEWPFETVRWPGREITWEDWDQLPDANRAVA